MFRPVMHTMFRPVLRQLPRRYDGSLVTGSSSGASDFSSGMYLKDIDGDFILDMNGNRIPVM